MDTGIKSGTSATIYILLGIIALLLAGNAFLFLTRDNAQSNLVTIREEKVVLRQELDDLERELEEVNRLNLDLSAELRAKQQELREKIAELQKALDNNKLTARQLQKAKSEVASLQNYVDSYLSEISILRRQRRELIAENRDLRSTVEVEKQKNRELSTRNSQLSEQISEAAILKAEKVSVTTFYSRMSNGREVDDHTIRSGRVNKVRVEFTFYPNMVAEEGKREIYLCVFDPRGHLLAPEASGEKKTPPVFTSVEGEEVRCTARSTIFYSRSNPVYSVELPGLENIEKGTYKVQLFTDGYRIGEGAVTLR